ncbi:MAG: ATP-binding protein, partial [Myxococcaceae bacterium]
RLAEERAAELQASEGRYRLLFEHSPIPMWVFDRETLAFLAVNDAAVSHYGYSREEFAKMTLKDIRDPSQHGALMQNISTLKSFVAGNVWKHKKRNGQEIDVQVSSHELIYEGRPAQLAAIHDVTEQRKLEEQFRQAQKMDAIGHLAGGVAHDFNNLLTAMLSFTGFALQDLPQDHPTRADLTEVLNAGQRAATLTRQLLTFSRRQVVEPQILDVNAIVSEAEKMLRRLIGSSIELDTSFEKNLPPVMMDRGHLDQVVMNLVVNARDAMGEHGKLTIETSLVQLDDTYVRGHVGAKPGRYVMLAVSDTGCGMDEETQARIFEPFFTTKPAGKGTGLGLSTVFGIVKQAGGDLRVYSSPGHGSTFKIYLPAAASHAAASTSEPRAAPTAGREQILLVEDDDAVRAVARRTLKSGGYALLEATSPAHALELLAQKDTAVHLLLTDIVMPKMNGRELAERAAKLRPGLKILFMSGYTGGAMVHQGVVESGAAYLQKPFTPESLLAKLRATLDAKP